MALLVSAQNDDSVEILRSSLFQLGDKKHAKKVVSIQQVKWDLSISPGETYGWGQISINSRELRNRLKKLNKDVSKPTYINVVRRNDDGTPRWLVENLRMPPVPCKGSSDRWLAYPMTKYFSIENGQGALEDQRVDRIEIIVLASNDPIPVVRDSLQFMAENYNPYKLKMEEWKENTDGDLNNDDDPPTTSRQIASSASFSNPPAPVNFDSIINKEPTYPKCIVQEPFPNIECASRQCVPMSVANALQYLENQANSDNFWMWTLPDDPIPGHGDTEDNIEWNAEPRTSLAANIDKYTQRINTTSFSSGSPTNRCQRFDGIFKYLKNKAKASFKHQGGKEKYGKDHTCDDTDYAFDQVSVRSDKYPTWKWMFDELSIGNAVIMTYGRYDDVGKRTGGHALRVFGACTFGYSQYIYTLDDGKQGDKNGNKNKGLRLQSFEVWDSGDSGNGTNPGDPDGQLNLDGTNWELEWAQSIHKIPQLGFQAAPPS